MLNQGTVPAPGIARDPTINVRVLIPFFIAGKECTEGSIVRMLTSDARAAATNHIPPRVEFI